MTLRNEFWIVRDGSNYIFYRQKPTRAKGWFMVWAGDRLYEVCAKEFHKISTLRMRESHNPRRVRLTIEDMAVEA